MIWLRKRWLWPILILLTFLRLWLAYKLPLSPDEAYYWLWSKHLDYSYYDHPPMVAIWIKIGCWLGGNTSLGVRLMAPLAGFFGSIFLYNLTRAFKDNFNKSQNPQILSVLALNATLAVNVGAVTMTPDTPLLFFICIALWACGRLIETGNPFYHWILGLTFGGALLSKYTAILFILGFCLWCLYDRQGRVFLKDKSLWGSALLTNLIFLPVLIWNAHHQWVSFLKQGGRIGHWQPQRSLQFLAELFFGQMGLITPVLYVSVLIGLFRISHNVFTKKSSARNSYTTLLYFVTIVPLIIFIQHAFGDRVQANWMGMLYPAFCLIAVIWGGYRIKLGIGCGLIISMIIYLQAVFHLLPLSSKLDITLRQLGGWPEFARELNQSIPATAPILVQEYGLAAELKFYLPDRTLVAIDKRWQYFPYSIADNVYSGYFIQSSRRNFPFKNNYFSFFEDIDSISRKRGDNLADTYKIFKVKLDEKFHPKHIMVILP